MGSTELRKAIERHTVFSRYIIKNFLGVQSSASCLETMAIKTAPVETRPAHRSGQRGER